MSKGLLIVYTGSGKGKTTAALGQAMRAAGQDFRVCLIQFVKGGWKTGESRAAVYLADRLEFHSLGRGFIRLEEAPEKDREAALNAWAFAKEKINSGKYEMVILDELTYLIKYKILTAPEVVAALTGRPSDLHVVVTGRDAPDELVEAADLVTEMKEVKHPHHIGVKAQKGIEY